MPSTTKRLLLLRRLGAGRGGLGRVRGTGTVSAAPGSDGASTASTVAPAATRCRTSRRSRAVWKRRAGSRCSSRNTTLVMPSVTETPARAMGITSARSVAAMSS